MPHRFSLSAFLVFVMFCTLGVASLKDFPLNSAFAAVPKDSSEKEESTESDSTVEDEGEAVPEGEETPPPSTSPTSSPSPTPTLAPRFQPLKFGFILPLTGVHAEWGKLMYNSVKLAFDDIDPETRAKMAIIVEDDQLKSPLAISAFKKLSETDKVVGLVTFSAEIVSSVAPLAESAEIPMFAITSSKDAVKGKLYSFRHWLDSSEQIRTLIPFMTDHDIHTVAIAVAPHELMQDYAAKFAVAAAQANINLVAKEEFSSSETAFKKIIDKTKEEPVDALLIALLPPQISAFSKALRNSGNASPLFGFSNIENVTEVKSAAGALDGVIYTAPRLSKDFVKRYQERYGEYPEISTANIYDIVRIFGDAVKSGAQDARAITNFIRRLKDYNGVMGTYSITGENGFSISAELKKIQRGSFRKIED